jgi:hypothetical protein
MVEYLCDGMQQLRFYRATGNLPSGEIGIRVKSSKIPLVL